MIARPCSAAMETSRALSFPVGIPEISLPEAFPAAVFLPGFLRAEVEVLDADPGDAGLLGPVQEPGQGVADLRVTVVGGAGQVVGEAVGFADRVAVRIEAVGGEVVGVGVDPDHTPGPGGVPRDGLHEGALPGRGQIPAAPGGVEVDAVGDGPIAFDAVGPLHTPVRERHGVGEGVAPV